MSSSKKIINIPNILAFIRVLLAPLMLFVLIERDNPIFDGIHFTWLDFIAAFIFAIASLTDFFDGHIARNWNQMTKFGAIIDPLADKMLVLAGFIGLVYLDRGNLWLIYFILIREFFISGIRASAASQNIELPSSMIGKTKTVIQMIAIGFLIMQSPYANMILWVAFIFTIYSGYEYVRDYTREVF